MQVELYCTHCCSRFVAPPETSAMDILERMDDQGQGPWFGLGDGETFEDLIFNALTEQGAIHCPECGQPVSVCEESLSQLAMEMLSQW